MTEQQPYTGKGHVTKQEVREFYGISHTTLSKLLNHRYYLKLEPLGYKKQSKILSPAVFNKFKEIYGDPL